uniref:Rab-like protein 3 n=1 Tax=Parascaris univalens TaxID=6257 RepID=A0A914ZG54_PARUN
MELSLRCFFRDFNAAKFVLYNCLVGFCVLFALRLDETVQLNYAIVFLPLWLCEAIVFIGAFVALISYIISPPSTSELAIRSDFYGLILCAGEHSLLTMFEVLVCYKLQSQLSLDELPWLLVFAPLFTLSLLSIVIAVWAIRHDKSFEFELFFSINVVQFVFLAFKLDATLDWHWAIVFIPLWVVLSLSVVGVLYALVLAIVLARSVHMLASQRRQHLYSALCHTLLVIPILVFLLLLTGKLDAVAWSEDEQVTQSLRKNHPDKGGVDASAVKLITNAWKTLKEDSSRKSYDIWLREQQLRAKRGIVGSRVVVDESTQRVEQYCRRDCDVVLMFFFLLIVLY